MSESGTTSPTIGDNIRAERVRLRLTQRQLAALLDVRPETIANWECGRSSPSADHIAALTKALRVSVTVFFPSLVAA